MLETLRFPVIPCQRYSVTEFRYKFVMSIGKRLKQRRIEIGLEVADVAKRVGMAASTLYDLERGDQHSSAKLAALCRLYGLNPDWAEFNTGPRLLSELKGQQRVAEPAVRYTLHGMQVTPEEVEMGIEWGKLEEPARQLIRQRIYLLVAEQVRKRRSSKKRSDGDDQRNAGKTP